MKWYAVTAFAILVIIPQLFSCADLTGGLDDQSPVLFVTIVNNTGTPISSTCPVYLVYYTNSNWTNPWLQQVSTTGDFINPVVGMLSVYIMAFLDTNNNGVVDTGEPCTGYLDKYHAATIDVLTKLEFLPLEWKELTITLDNAVAHQYQP
jgi:hypothetical protein